MLNQVAATEYETKAFEFAVAAKTFRIAGRTFGDYVVTSHMTSSPSAKGFWGCRVFRSLPEVEQHYKSLKGISILLSTEF